MFRGRFDHSIDSKGRLAIPRAFRDDLTGGEDNPPMLVNQQGHLALYPAQEWEAFEQQLRSMPRFDPAAQRLRRFFGSGSVACPIDSQGRILVPAYLREHAALEDKVIVAGVFDAVELWNPARFETAQSEITHGLDDIQRTVEEQPRSDA